MIESKKVIYDKNNDFGDIMILSLRYALGRRTYVTDEVPEFIIQNKKYINERICIVMLRDLDYYFDNRKNNFVKDDECDFKSWINLQNWLFNYAKEQSFDIINYKSR